MRFDAFIEEHNRERPHQALAMKGPRRSLHGVSATLSRAGAARLSLPRLERARDRCGRVCFKGGEINLSQVVAGQQVGVRQIDDRIWLVSCLQENLGFRRLRRAGWSR